MPRICRRLRERLPEYLAGGLGGRARSGLARHLQACARCSSELDQLRTLMRALRSVGPDEVPADLVQQVQRAARQAAAPSPTATRLWVRLAVPAALAVGVVAAAVMLRLPGPPVSTKMTSRARAVPSAVRAPSPTALARAARAPAASAAGPATAPRPSVIARKPPQAAPAPVGEDKLTAAPPPSPFQIAEAPAAAERQAMPAAKEEDRAGAQAEEGATAAGLGAARPMPGRPALDSSRRAFGRAARGPTPGGRGPNRHLSQGRERRAKAAGGAGPGVGFRAGGGLGGGGAAPQVPALAGAALTRQDGGPAIVLQFGTGEPVGNLVVSLGAGEKRRTVYQGPAGAGVPVVFPLSKMGPGPTNILLTIESASGTQRFQLFAPTLARLGEVAPKSPRAHYDGQPLQQVLADLSALTGLVVLAQGPLDRRVVGDLPAGSPELALQQIAESAGLQVQRQDKAIYLLTPRPQ